MSELPLPILHETLDTLPGNQLQSLRAPCGARSGTHPARRVVAGTAVSIPLGVACTMGAFALAENAWITATVAVGLGFTLAAGVAVALQRSVLVRGCTPIALCNRGLTFGDRSWPWAAMDAPRVTVVDALAFEEVVPVPAFAFDCGGRVEAFRFASPEEATHVLTAVEAHRS